MPERPKHYGRWLLLAVVVFCLITSAFSGGNTDSEGHDDLCLSSIHTTYVPGDSNSSPFC